MTQTDQQLPANCLYFYNPKTGTLAAHAKDGSTDLLELAELDEGWFPVMHCDLSGWEHIAHEDARMIIALAFDEQYAPFGLRREKYYTGIAPNGQLYHRQYNPPHQPNGALLLTFFNQDRLILKRPGFGETAAELIHETRHIDFEDRLDGITIEMPASIGMSERIMNWMHKYCVGVLSYGDDKNAQRYVNGFVVNQELYRELHEQYVNTRGEE